MRPVLHKSILFYTLGFTLFIIQENIRPVLCTSNIHTIVDPPLRNSTSRLTRLFL